VVHRLLVCSGALVTALILVFAVGLWRLMQGPIDLDELTPFVQEMLGRSVEGLNITVSGGHFGLDATTHSLVLQLEGVRLSRADGEPVASLPSVAASFSIASLLRARAAPTRLILHRPVLRFVRDEDGAVRLGFGDQDTEASGITLEMVAPLAGPARPDQPLGLMRRVIIRDATLVLDDRQTGGRWQADRVDATAERTAAGLAGDLSLALSLGARHPELRINYRYSSADQKLDLGIEVGAVEPAALASLAPELAPLQSAQFPISGTLTTRLDLATVTTEGVRVDLHFGTGWLKSELLPEGALRLEEGSLHAVYAPESNELRLSRLALDLGGGSGLTFNGSLAGVTPGFIAGANRPVSALAGHLGITLVDVPVNKFETFWPPALSRNGRRWVLANVHDGVLDEAAVQLNLEVDPAVLSAEVVSAHGSMRYHDATISYFQGLPPVRKVSGTATLEDKRLVFTPKAGTVKSVQVTGGSLKITDLGSPVEWLTVDLSTAGPIQDVLEVIDTKPLRYAHEVGVDPARVAGRTEANFHFKLPLLRDLKLDQVQYGVRASLTGAAIDGVAMDRNLTDGTFALEIGGHGARLQGDARFDGVPVNLDANLLFKHRNGPRARYRVALMLNDQQRRRLGFDFFPDRIAGPIGIELTYNVFDADRAEAEAAIDLRAAALSVSEAGWKKPPGGPATARLVAELRQEQITRIRDIEVRAPGLEGRLAISLTSGTGRLNGVEVQRLVIGNDDVAGLVTRRQQGGWYVDLRGASLDLSHWIKDLGDSLSRQSSRADPPLQLNAQIGRVTLGPHREVRDFTANLLRNGGDWQAAQIDARFTNGRQLSLRSGTRGGTPGFVLNSDDLGSALRLFDITDDVVGGRLAVTARVGEVAGKRILSGSIEGGDYSLVRAPAIARILTLPSFSGMGSMLAGSGIPFSTLRGEFALAEDRLTLDKVVAYGEAIGVTGNGVVDLHRDRLDLQGTIVPAYALNSILGNVPIVGSLLLGGEGQGLFAANYRVTGPAGEPQISVNPLSALAPGFLRRLLQPNFGLPESGQQPSGAQ
jgi:uncharacterized protein YhdP